MKILCLLAAAAVLATIAVDTASAATPRQATKQIAACLLDGGAHRVERRGADGGRALYGHRSYVGWAYLTVYDDGGRVQDGQVIGVIEVGEARTARQRRAVTRCMAPFNR